MCKRRDFLRLLKGGRRFIGKLICIDYSPAPLNLQRLGITASSRFGKAYERNRFKRLVREAFRTADFSLTGDLNVIPRQRAKHASMQDIQSEILSLLSQNQKL